MIIEIITFIELMILVFISVYGTVFCDKKRHRIFFFILAVGFLAIFGLFTYGNWFN